MKILLSLSSTGLRKTFPGKLTFDELKAEIQRLPKVNPYTVIYDVTDRRGTTTGDNLFNLLTRLFGADTNEVCCIKWANTWYVAGFNLKGNQ